MVIQIRPPSTTFHLPGEALAFDGERSSPLFHLKSAASSRAAATCWIKTRLCQERNKRREGSASFPKSQRSVGMQCSRTARSRYNPAYGEPRQIGSLECKLWGRHVSMKRNTICPIEQKSDELHNNLTSWTEFASEHARTMVVGLDARLCSVSAHLSASISREHSSAASARSRRDSFSEAVFDDTRSAARLFSACQ